MPGVKDRTAEFLKEVELADGEKQSDKKKSKMKSSSPSKSKFRHLKPNLLLRSTSDLEKNIYSVEGPTDLSTFLSIVAKTRRVIDEMKSTSTVINTKSLDLINSPFQEDHEAKKHEVHQLLASMKTNTNIVNKNLIQMKLLIQREEQNQQTNTPLSVPLNSSNELRIRQTQYLILVNDFRDAINTFNNQSASARSQCLNRIQNRLSITGSSKTAEQVEDLMESGNWSIFTEGLLMDTQLARDELNQLEARCKLILQLETTVTELHQMFMQLSMLVEGQGEMIDNIEHNVTNTQEYIENAEKQLKDARKSKKRARRCKVYTGIGATVGVVVVCLVVFI